MFSSAFTQKVALYKIPDGLGGALLVRSGDIIVTMKPQKYILEKDHDYIINLYPDERESSTFIYEDDGYTYDYQDGGFATTRITSSGIRNGELTLGVKMREGAFLGRPENGHDIINNSIPKIVGTPEIKDIDVIIHGRTPASILGLLLINLLQ